MNNNQKDALRQVMETGFAVDDIILYLDTHADDPHAMEYFHSANRANQDAVRAYEAAYCPLMKRQVNSASWDWINGPWPWEGGR